MSNNFTMKDSGHRESFTTGAVRDTSKGKGCPELISPIAIRRLAIVLEKGKEKYAERNWEKGMEIGRILQSAIRHIYDHIEGKRDEDHLGHAMFNVMAAIHIGEMIDRGLLPKELDNLPNYLPNNTNED